MQYFSHGHIVELNWLMAEKHFEILCRDMLQKSKVLLNESLNAAASHCSGYISESNCGVNSD